MDTSDLPALMVEHLQDAHALEHSMQNVLDAVLQTSKDQQMTSVYTQVRATIVQHGKQVQARLEALGHKPSAVAEAGAAATSYVQGMAVHMRSAKPAKNARDVYVLLHLGVAGYELLGRIAQRAGDVISAQLARRIGDEDRDMAKQVGEYWNRVIDLTLAPPGQTQMAASTAATAGPATDSTGHTKGGLSNPGAGRQGDVDADLGMGLPR